MQPPEESHTPPAAVRGPPAPPNTNNASLWSALWSTVWGGAIAPVPASAASADADSATTSTSITSPAPRRRLMSVPVPMQSSGGVNVDLLAVRLTGQPVRPMASRAVGQVILALWDNIAGPRVEYVWTKDWTLTPAPAALPSKLNSNIIEDYMAPTPSATGSSSLHVEDPPAKTDAAAPSTPPDDTSSGTASPSPETTNHLSWNAVTVPMELAQYVARYTLGGELMEIASNNANSSGRSKQSRESAQESSNEELLGKSPSFFDPLNLSSSPTASSASGPTPLTTTGGAEAGMHPGTLMPDGEKDMLMNDEQRLPPRSVSDQRAVAVDYKMHVFDEADYFTEAALFTAPYANPMQQQQSFQKTKFAISVLLPKAFLEGYLRHHEAMLDRLNQLVVIYLYLLQLRPLQASALLHSALVRLVAQMNDLLCVTPPAVLPGTSTAAGGPTVPLPAAAMYQACSRKQPALQKTLFGSPDLNFSSMSRSLPTLYGAAATPGVSGSSASVGNYGSIGAATASSPSRQVLDFAAAFVAASDATSGGSAKLPSGGSSSANGDAELQQQQRQKRSKMKAFLSLVVTSHLQTHFRTVVLGEDVALVNQYVNTLLLMVPQEERERSAEAAVGRGYVPDLLVQGVLGRRIPDEAIIQSVWPTTLVDLNTGSVTQTYPFHEYKVLRREYHKSVIHKLLKSSSRSTNLWTAQESVFQPVKDPSPLVKKVVSETLRIPAYLRPGFFSASLKGLMTKAYVLIKYVEAFSRQQQVRLERERRRELQQQQQAQPTNATSNTASVPAGVHTHDHSDTSADASRPQSRRSSPLSAAIPITLTPATAAAAAAAAATTAGVNTTSVTLTPQGPWTAPQHPYPIEFTSSPHLIQRIQRDLELTSPCYYVLLGIAELIKPGIYRALAGDPASQELRWIELFESF